MFESFFPKPKLFFLSAVAWVVFSIGFWYFQEIIALLSSITGNVEFLSQIKISLSKNIFSETVVKKDGFWEVNLKNIELGSYDLKIELTSQNQVISLETSIFNGLINSELLQKKKIIVEDGNPCQIINSKNINNLFGVNIKLRENDGGWDILR